MFQLCVSYCTMNGVQVRYLGSLCYMELCIVPLHEEVHKTLLSDGPSCKGLPSAQKPSIVNIPSLRISLHRHQGILGTWHLVRVSLLD